MPKQDTHARSLTLAVDPASARLKPGQVVEVHKMHARGIGWDLIAAEMGTTRKNVARIVTGARWAQLHPLRRPELYASRHANEERASKPALVIEEGDPLAETMTRIYQSLRAS